jgi:hypothetical protein
MSTDTLVDAVALREEVKDKYRDVALDPHGEFHFHTGRPLAKRLGYDDAVVGAMPDAAVESFADIANGQPVPEAAVSNIDLWTALIAGGMPCAGWQKMMRDTGFVELELGPAIDTFAGAGGEPNARKFEVFGYPFLGRKP